MQMFIPEFPGLESYKLYLNIKTLKYNKLVMGKLFLNELQKWKYINRIFSIISWLLGFKILYISSVKDEC